MCLSLSLQLVYHVSVLLLHKYELFIMHTVLQIRVFPISYIHHISVIQLNMSYLHELCIKVYVHLCILLYIVSKCRCDVLYQLSTVTIFYIAWSWTVEWTLLPHATAEQHTNSSKQHPRKTIPLLIIEWITWLESRESQQCGWFETGL